MAEGADIKDFLPPQFLPCFDFKTTTQSDIAQSIAKLSFLQAAGHDGLTSLMVKDARRELLPILECRFNQSIFWKDAIVTPLHKGGDKLSLDNYRPLSVLSTVSKLLEHGMYNQLYEYLSRFRLVCI